MFKVRNLPNSRKGSFEIISFFLTGKEKEFKEQARKGRPLGKGWHKALIRYDSKDGLVKKVTVMSDTESELRDNNQFIKVASGHVLIMGLGLGCIIEKLIRKRSIKSITVIEKYQDVIDLVLPHIRDPRLKVIHADCLEYTPAENEKYDYIWHDIWDFIDCLNLPEMELLKNRWKGKAKRQLFWAKRQCKYHGKKTQIQIKDDYSDSEMERVKQLILKGQKPTLLVGDNKIPENIKKVRDMGGLKIVHISYSE